MVLGFLRPIIVLPKQFLEQENSSAVRQALRHEWAHIDHGDALLAGILRTLIPVLYLHPLFWWLRQMVAMNQELLADRAVASHSAPTSYAGQSDPGG